MESVSAKIFLYNPEYDGAKRDLEWASKAITNIRMYWRRYVDIELLRENKKFLLSEFTGENLAKLTSQFKDKGFLESVEFRNIGSMDAILNTIMEELTKDPPKAELRSSDPGAQYLRQKDLGLLKNRGMIEAPLSAIQKGIGDPSKYKVDPKIYKSNVTDFDDMGLDIADPDDVRFFTQFHKLDCDIALQTLVNKIMELNRFDEEILRKLVIDIMAIRKISLQAYVDKITGQIKYNYIYPDTAWGVFGDSFDGHDDDAKGWQDSRSLTDFLQMAGNDFDFERDWKKLLACLNFSNDRKFTGFDRAGKVYNCFNHPDSLAECGLTTNSNVEVVKWNDCFRFKVSMGYIEMRTWEATSTNKFRTRDDAFVDAVPYAYDLEGRGEQTEYYLEAAYQQQWYGAYFLSTSNTTQLVFNYSKVYYQQFEGANDEFSSGTMVFYRENGNPAMSSVKSDCELIWSTYYKMLYLIYKAKPQTEEFVYNELIEQAKIYVQAFPGAKGVEDTVPNIIEKIIQNSLNNSVSIRMFPQIEGRTIGQIPALNQGHRGIDPLTGIMQAVVEWGEARLAKKILGNAMRLGMNPQSRESTQSEQNTFDASRNSTGYMYRMVQYTKQRIATITTLYAQDIIKFKDSLPYNFLLKLLGNERFNALEELDECALHRYGKFFKDYNVSLAKQDLRQAAAMALGRPQNPISYFDFMMVTETEDVWEAGRQLALIEYRAAKKLRQQQMQDQNAQMQLQQQMHANDMELETLKGKNNMDRATADNQALILANQIQVKGKESVKQMGIESEPTKISYQTQGKQDLEVTKANLQASQPLGV